MNEIQNTPELRFEGFTEPWEQQKLRDIAESYSGGTPTSGNTEYYGGDIPFIRSAEISSDTTELSISRKGYESSAARMVKPGDVLYALYGATSGEVAISKMSGAINQAILAILPSPMCDAFFLAAWLRRQKDEIVATYLQGGQGNLSATIVKGLDVPVPVIEEQRCIGTLFSRLDSLIALYQRKYERLQHMKQALLRKMFPKPGEQVPELRFDGFTEPWEQRKLGELVGFSRGQGLSWNDICDDGHYSCVLYGNLYTDYGAVISNIKYKTNVSPISMITSHQGDVLIPASDTTPTGLARAACILPSGVILGGDINILRPSKALNGCFLSFALNYYREELIKRIKGTTVRHLQGTDLKDVRLILPISSEEQVAIANVFQRLDALITLHQRKYERLQHLKQALLRKMFV